MEVVQPRRVRRAFVTAWLRRRQRALLGVGVSGALLPLLLFGWVHVSTAVYRYDTPAAVPPARIAIVLGAGVYGERVSRVLADRLNVAIELYRQGRVQKVLMTGDNSRVDYDEVSAMQAYVVQRGIPAADVTLDYAGFSTYDSCFRAKAIFGVQQAVVVTQAFHLPRAVYTCRALGIDATGLQTTRNLGWLWYSVREIGASSKAVWDVHVTRPLPRFLGPFEGIR